MKGRNLMAAQILVAESQYSGKYVRLHPSQTTQL